ncbi:hypothetical protein J010_00031 [Cryptococcus neoformans]|nr:hypothetical protein C355_00049 [Cryptococcus neoformans var. grubii Th84]OXH20150.1 hypothetical protein J010_00031 [Cryptococcus neoformans var. grubii]OXH39802.1 hypothetical protein J009_00050 [Cryptococcus neoformans var. grubii]OXH60263.1 hypothetical protein J003_00058 [Cryptococcus neoformans var. grubii]OXH61052.1 hypothetical protein J004_00054 [Cryptococcus neoformans var. grubii]
MPPVVSSVVWFAQNAQYIIAFVLGATALVFSCLAYLILRWVLPNPFSGLFSSKLHPRRKLTKAKGRTPNLKKTTSKGRVTRNSSSGLVDNALTMIGTGLIICSIISAVICTYSLTSQGCETLRHFGLIEWLPWKTGLRCYRSRWDWVGEFLGELLLTLLQKSEYGTAAMKTVENM